MMKADKPDIKTTTDRQALSEEELRLLFENMISPFSYYRMVYDAEGRPVDYIFLAVNRAFEAETGKRREEIVGKNVLSVFPATEHYWIEILGRVAKTGVAEQITDYASVFGKWYNVRAYSPKPDHVAITVSDMTNYVQERESLYLTAQELETQQAENYRLAHEEPITGLPNRACLYEAFAAKTAEEMPARFSIAIFAPDNLSELLATYGSTLSDRIMRAMSRRVAVNLKEQAKCFSMTGTDLVLLDDAPCDERQTHQTLNRALRMIRLPLEVDGANYYITASCGVACYPEDGTDHEDLIMKANLALYQAKKIGEPIVFFDDQIGERLQRRTRIRNALPKALENKEFELFFQPQLLSSNDRVAGFEALLRWHSSELGEISPLEFIDIAEESRMIQPLGAWVLSNACQAMREITQLYPCEFIIGVNVSGVQLIADHFTEKVLAVLREYDLAPEQLELEVTESVLVNRDFNAIEKLNSLHAHGVRIALDDFGTGYSSLSLLKDLKITTLKIDKSFIQAPKAAAMTEMMVRLGNMIGAKIVAEGVETEEQLRMVRKLGCERVQGFYRALPMPLDNLKRFLAARLGRP